MCYQVSVILKAGRVIWITGLSGSGKTTLAREIQHLLNIRDQPALLLDGDELREAILGSSNDQTQQFDQAKREELAFTYCRLAKLFVKQGYWTIVSTISMRKSVFAWNRENLPNYFEILIDLPLRILEERDPKNIYADFKNGKRKNVIGLDINAEMPLHPELIFNETNLKSPLQMAKTVINMIEPEYRN